MIYLRILLKYSYVVNNFKSVCFKLFEINCLLVKY